MYSPPTTSAEAFSHCLSSRNGFNGIFTLTLNRTGLKVNTLSISTVLYCQRPTTSIAGRMISIHIRISGASLLALFAALVACAPCVLAVILACGPYNSVRHLQIPTAMLGGFEGLNFLCFFLPVFITTMWQPWFPSILLTVSSGCVGLWWLAERLQTGSFHSNWPLEVALLVLWLISFGTSLVVCACALARFTCEKEELLKSPSPSGASWPETLVSDHPISDALAGSPFLAPPSTPDRTVPAPAQRSMHGSPRSPRSQPQPRTVSPQKSYTPKRLSPGKNHTPLRAKESQTSLGSVFSFKRSPSKLAKKTQDATIPSLAGLEALPEGYHPQEPARLGPLAVNAAAAVGLDDVEWDESLQAQDRMKWIMMNAIGEQSRSASGSTDLSGSLFSAAEYNRQINDAGFVKDEPIPVPRRHRP